MEAPLAALAMRGVEVLVIPVGVVRPIVDEQIIDEVGNVELLLQEFVIGVVGQARIDDAPHGGVGGVAAGDDC